MNDKWIKMYLDIATRLSRESHATKLKVGAVFVSASGVMATGINGLPAGGSNICEYDNKTLPEVSHAEEAVMTKLLRQGVSTVGGYIFCTHSPCINCAKLLANSGIKTIWYLEDYRCSSGIDYLGRLGVEVIRYDGFDGSRGIYGDS